MRIGLVVERFDPSRGGLEQWSWRFCQWLAERGNKVHVITRLRGKRAVPPGVQCHLVPAGRSRLAFARAAEEACRQLDLDIIHDTGAGWYCDIFQPHMGSPMAARERRLAMRGSAARFVGRLAAGLLPRWRELTALTKRQYRLDGPRVIALSRMVRDDLMRWHGVPGQNIHLIPNGVNLEQFSPARREEHREQMRAALGITPEEILVLLVAHNYRLKGGPELSAAIRMLRKQGIPARGIVLGPGRVSIAGKVDEKRPVAQLAPVTDPVPYYAAADVYAHPTHYDPCSLVVLEAMAMGLPIVTTRYNGAAELMAPGIHGHILDEPRDIVALAKSILELADTESGRAMGAAARLLAEEHGEEVCFGRIVQLYRDHIAQRCPMNRSAA